jgi:hypothetical protein
MSAATAADISPATRSVIVTPAPEKTRPNAAAVAAPNSAVAQNAIRRWT